MDRRFLQIRADVAAQAQAGEFSANASVGFAAADTGPLTQQAWLNSDQTGAHAVSREHWAGWDLLDGSVLVRAGRIALPFGLRTLEHTLWVRSETRTDIEQNQQHGLAAAIQ